MSSLFLLSSSQKFFSGQKKKLKLKFTVLLPSGGQGKLTVYVRHLSSVETGLSIWKFRYLYVLEKILFLIHTLLVVRYSRKNYPALSIRKYKFNADYYQEPVIILIKYLTVSACQFAWAQLVTGKTDLFLWLNKRDACKKRVREKLGLSILNLPQRMDGQLQAAAPVTLAVRFCSRGSVLGNV